MSSQVTRLRDERLAGTDPAGDPDALARHLVARVAKLRLIGRSPAFLEVTRNIPVLADCDVGVLITGETGTGKEFVARAIHYLSPRAAGPFVPVNSGAIPQDLVENELFGHEKGAFTGAYRAQLGLVEEADGGTLFLDEVDSLPLVAQVKLLRFLQEREYRRLGSTRARASDVRVLAATNTDVARAVDDGTLRSDLYYRLNVVPLELPPLRERREDVPLLARHFLARDAQQLGRAVDGFSDAAMEALLYYDWPGNVRELENVVRRAVVLCGKGRIGPAHMRLPEERARPRTFKEAKAQVVARFEQGYVETLLAAHDGNITHAARAARKNRRVFFELIRKHGIDAARFRGGERARA